jgi:hypothetical protein
MNRYWMIAALAGALVLSRVNEEYNSLKASVADAKVQSMGVVDDVRKILDSINKTIEELREKLFRLEAANKRLEQANQELMSSLQRHEAQANKSKQEQPADPAPLVEPTVKPTQAKIVMHSGANCEPCKIWKRDHMPDWKAKGWLVEVVDETSTSKGWPWFEICEGDVCYEVRGFLTADSYFRAKSRMKR